MSLSFTGYAAIWDRMDRVGDVVRRGAFAGAGEVPLLWQHRGRRWGGSPRWPRTIPAWRSRGRR